MPRKSEDSDLTPAQADAIISAVDNHNAYYSDVVRIVNCSQSTIESLVKRVHEKADKKNISSLQVVNAKQPRSDRPLKLDYRDRRRLIKHAIKNKANRRKT